MKMSKEIEWLFNTPICHRGLHNGGDIAENSMTAFKKAIEKGYNIEIDVHTSADGNIIVFHDYNLKRVCGVDISPEEINSSELSQYKLNGTEDSIPTLKELLQVIDGKVGLLIEIKYKAGKKYRQVSPKVYELIKDYKGKVAIQSFSPTIVKWFKNNAPEIPRGLLATGYQELKIPSFVKSGLRSLNRLIGGKVFKITDPNFIAYNVMSFPSPTMKRVREGGMPFLTWTVNSEKAVTLAKEWADNVIFERIDIEKLYLSDN